jgi:hypothetical protein
MNHALPFQYQMNYAPPFQPHMHHCHIPYIHASLPDFGIQIRSGPILRSASDLIYDKLPKFISYSFNVITAYSFIQ